MTPEQVNKSIGQMRQMFGFLGILTGLGALSSLLAIASDASYVVMLLIYGAVCACFWIAVVNLGKRNKIGHTFAKISSIIFLLGFPVLTIFGAIYLSKLSKPEMKAALNAV